MLEARAFWVTAPGHGEIRVQQLRSPAPSELLIRTSRSAISRGTESLVFRGEVPQSEWRRMRCPFQEGEFPGPVKYGYSAVGIVARASPSERAKTRRASRTSTGECEDEMIRIDISIGSMYLAIVPCRDSIDKRWSVRPFLNRVYSDA